MTYSYAYPTLLIIFMSGSSSGSKVSMYNTVKPALCGILQFMASEWYPQNFLLTEVKSLDICNKLTVNK